MNMTGQKSQALWEIVKFLYFSGRILVSLIAKVCKRGMIVITLARYI
jgi:hypothetical protein